MSIFTNTELWYLISFYRKGPLVNKLARKLTRDAIAVLRARKV